MLTSIEIKLLPDVETKLKIQEILQRDTKVLNRVLGILQHYEDKIYSCSKLGKYRTSRTTLHHYMISTEQRSVPFDLKTEFPNMSHNEIVESIDLANEMYSGYLAIRSNQKNSSPPSVKRIISRRIGYRRFEIDLDENIITTMYSCKTNLVIASGKQSRILHDRISFKFVPNLRADEYLSLGKAKTMKIFLRDDRYYAKVAVEIEISEYQPPDAPLAIVGIDLGIAKTATAVLYTEQGIQAKLFLNDLAAKEAYTLAEQKLAKLQQIWARRNSKRYIKSFQYISSTIDSSQVSQYLLYLNQQIKQRSIQSGMIDKAVKIINNNSGDPKYQQRLTSMLLELQHMIEEDVLDRRQNLKDSLHRLRKTSARYKDEMIKQLCHQLQTWIQKFANQYNLYVIVGKPNGIQYRYRRGTGNKWLRKKIHSWAFHKFQMQLRHNLHKIGMQKRYIGVPESWTSKICYRCNKRGIRPTQTTFHCSNYNCGIKINADINGATNIAKRGIIKLKLIQKSDYPKWNIKVTKKNSNEITVTT